MDVNEEIGRRAMLEGRLAAIGVSGPYGLLKYKGARSGDGWVVDGLPYLIEEILADPAGIVERVLVSGPNKMPFWLDPETYSVVGCTGNAGIAALFVMRLPWHSSAVDFMALAPKATPLTRFTYGKPFSGELRRRSVVIRRPGTFAKAA